MIRPYNEFFGVGQFKKVFFILNWCKKLFRIIFLLLGDIYKDLNYI